MERIPLKIYSWRSRRERLAENDTFRQRYGVPCGLCRNDVIDAQEYTRFPFKRANCGKAEDARKLYVAASRAQRLLVVAAPRVQAARLREHLSGQGAVVTIEDI